MIDFLLDPVLRAPLWGSTCLALAVSLIGVLLFVRRSTLVGETLSHASYPGVMVAIFFAPWIGLESIVLVFATLSALIGFWFIHLLREKLRVKEDSALCFVLATFFGMGTLLASVIQVIHPVLFRQVPVYLYGQAATMQDQHLYIYAVFACAVVLWIILCYRPLLVGSFDRNFIYSPHQRFMRSAIDVSLLIFVALAVVMGMRSLGIILLSALMIAPPIAARQFTHRLPRMFILSGAFGMLSGFVGTLLSLSGLPTGPCIVLVASSLALLSLLFAPQNGVIFRLIRISLFRSRIRQENVLKALWCKKIPRAPWWVWWVLARKGWIDSQHQLTETGRRQGARIVRLHRLWEAYLVYSLGMGRDQVHQNAEDMEHLLTPQLEQELEQLLAHPEFDPHAQPIPSREQVYA
ncbi:MAG: metal ABC transporter permease [Verrucomicrobia bacterium]|nr:metal ABC transporter permease [Verrucomicrobiota bacterium]MBS0645250.1 metal ABC transporter permease [Verrucomicrobiota bacterium]